MATANLDIVTRFRNESSAAVGQLGSDLDRLNEKATTVGRGFSGLQSLANAALAGIAGGVTALVGGLGAAGVAAFNLSGEIDQATDKLATDLGLSKEAASQFEVVMKGVFANNFGNDFADIGAAVAEVSRQLGSLPATEMQRVTEQAFALRDAWGLDVSESIGAANALMGNFGLTSQEAMNFLTAGIQRGLNSSGDFLDSITEYSTQFSAGGASAGQFFSLMETGLQQGMLGTDKAADMFKEFRLRITEGGPDVAAALKAIGLNAGEIAAGIADGTTTAADAFGMVTEALVGVDDKSAQFTAGIALMGSQFEDMGTEAALAVDLTATKLGDLAGVTDTLNQQYDNWPSMWEGIKRSALMSLEPLVEKLLGMANNVFPVFQDVLQNTVMPAVMGIADVFGSFIANLEEGMTPLDAFIEAIWDIAPEGLLETLTTFRDRVNDLKEGFELLGYAVGSILDGSADNIDYWWEIAEAFGFTSEQAEALNEPLWEMGNVISDIIQYVADLASGLQDGLTQALDGVRQLLEGDLSGAMETFRLAWETGWTAVVEFVGNLWELMEPYLAQAWESITTWFNEQPWADIGLQVVNFIIAGLTEFAALAQEKLLEWNQAFLDWAGADSWAEVGSMVATSIIESLSVFGEMVSAKLEEWNQAFLDWAGADSWTQIGNDVAALVRDGLSADFSTNIGATLGEWTQSLAAWAGSDGTSLMQIGVDVVGKVLDGLASFETEALTTLTEWTGSLTGWVSDYDWYQLGYDVTTAIITGLKAFVGLVIGAGGLLETWRQGFVAWASDTENWRALGQAVIDGIVAGWKFTATVRKAIHDFFRGAIQAVKDELGIASPSKVMMEIGKDTIQGFIDGIKGMVAQAAEIGRNIVDSVKGGIESKIGELAAKAAEMARRAIDAAKAALGISSPSKIFTAFGSFVGQGLAIGIEKSYGAVSKAGAGLATAVSSGFGGVGGGAGLDGIAGVLDSVLSVIGGLANKFGSELIDQVKKFSDAAKSVAGLFAPFLEAMAVIDSATRIGVNPTKLMAWKANVENIFNKVAEMAYYFGTMGANGALLSQTSQFSDTAIKITDLISKTMATIGELAQFDVALDIRSKVAAFAVQLQAIVGAVGNVAALFSVGLLAHLKLFAESAGAVLGLVKTAVDGLKALEGFTVGDLIVPMNLLVSNIYLLMGMMGEAAVLFEGVFLEHLASFAQSASAVTGMVAGAIASLKLLEVFTVGNLIAPMTALDSNIRLLVGLMGETAAQFSGDFLAHLETFVSAAGAVLGLVKTAVEVIRQIADFVPASGIQQATAVFASQLLTAVSVISSTLAAVSEKAREQLAAAAIMTNDVKSVLGVVKTAVDALVAIGQFIPIENMRAQVDSFGNQLVSAVAGIAYWFTKFSERIRENMAGAAEATKDVRDLLGVVKTAVDALGAIGLFIPVDNLRAKLDSFGQQLVTAVAVISVWFTKINERLQAFLVSAAALSGDVKNVLGLVKTAVDSLGAINEFVGVSQLEEKITLFMQQLVRTVAFMARQLVEGLGGLEESLASAGVLSGLSKEVLDTVKRGVDSLASLNEFVGVAQLEEKVTLFMSQLVHTVLFMTQSLNAGLLGLEESLASAGNLSGLAKDVLETVKRGVDSLLALNDFVGVANLEATLGLFGQQLVQTVISLTTGLNAGLVGMEEALGSAGNLSGLAKDVLETVKRGVDSLLALADFSGVVNLASTLDVFVAQLVFTVQQLTAGLNAGLAGMEESLTSAGILSGLAKDVLESVKRGVDSLTALGEFEGVANLGATLSLFSNQFTSAVQSVTGTLNNIAQTIGQEALTAAAGVAGTIKGIADSVLASIRTINDLATSEAPQSLQGIMNQLVSAVTVQVPNMETVGFNFGASFVTGVVGGFDLPTMTQTFYDAGFVTGQSFGYGIADGIYASIPTAVDAAMELAASVQAALGGLYGGGGVPSLPPIGAGGGGNGGNPIVIYGLTVQGVQNPADLVAQLEAYAG